MQYIYWHSSFTPILAFTNGQRPLNNPKSLPPRGGRVSTSRQMSYAKVYFRRNGKGCLIYWEIREFCDGHPDGRMGTIRPESWCVDDLPLRKSGTEPRRFYIGSVMTSTELVTLKKVLSLEKSKGYKNTAVVGGLDRFLARWVEGRAADSLIEPLPEEYASLKAAQRRKWIDNALTALETGASPPKKKASSPRARPSPKQEPSPEHSLDLAGIGATRGSRPPWKAS